MEFQFMHQLESSLTEAHVTTAKLRHAIEANHEVEAATLTTRLNELTSRLGLALWTIDPAKQNDRLALAINLKSLEEILEGTLALYPSQSDPLTNEQMVANISGGAALCGVRLGVAAWTGHREGLVVERSCKPVLVPPPSRKLTDPISPVLSRVEMFTTVRDATDFRQMVKTCGWSIGQALRASMGNHDRSRRLADEATAEAALTTSAAQVTCVYVPTQSFRLDLDDMHLSVQARAAAASVVDAESAVAFLRAFGSHVTCGAHDMGGIFFKTDEITTTDRTSVAELLWELEARSSRELSLGYGPFEVGMNGYTQVTGVEPSDDEIETLECHAVTNLDMLGPLAPSLEIFQEILKTDSHSWQLIDRPCRNSMVGVWELMANVGGCEQAADLVRRTWIEQVESLSGVPEIKQAIDRAVALGAPDDAVGAQCAAPDKEDGGRQYAFFMPSAAALATSVPKSSPVASEYGGLTYNHLLTVGPKPDRGTHLRDLIWYTIKHRLNIEVELYPSKLVAGKGLVKKGVAKAGSTVAQPVVLDALLGLIKSLDVTAKTEVFRLLLERRFLVPFLIPGEGKNHLTSEAHVLKFVNTVITDGVGGTAMACLMRDCSVLRVAVVSDRQTSRSATHDWIKNVFHIQSIHCLDRVHGNNVTALECVAEIGWGFLKRDGKCTTVMVLHVIGEYRRLDSFLEQFADALVVDVGQSCTPAARFPIQRGCVIKWFGTLEDEPSEDETEEGSPVTTILMRCTAPSSHALVTEYLLEYGTPHARSPVDEVAQVCGMEPSNSGCLQRSADMVCRDIEFHKIRLDELRLQRNFQEESKLLLARQRNTNGEAEVNYTDMIQQLKARNVAIARDVYGHPLIQHFVHVLQTPSAVEREVAIIDLEHHLASASEQTSGPARANYRAARDAFNRSRSRDTQAAYVAALDHWGLTVTGVEHLWRELSHVFAADPNVHQYLPEYAVTHLLDGFPMELMDGDAAMVNMTWITAILNRLEMRLPTARIFVLSIIGVQSSGKSTLLNYMFGVRFQTSVSRCTRGVSIQLLKCDGRTQYDYILLLDTEGIRSPEYVGTDDSVWRDNRMATLAILPADATIILTKGESTVTISEILPIVLSVFLDSALVEEHREEIASKFYFVFNQIDMSQATNMETIVDTLLENLRTNAKKIEAIRGNRSSQVESSTEYFAQFQVDIKDENASDVRFLGSIKGSSDPPLDAPLPNYGQRALAFRDYIHSRASDQPCRRISDVSQSLALVWDCINKANFQLNFIAAHERLSHDELVQVLTKHKQELARVHSAALEAVIKRICHDNSRSVRFDAGSSKYESQLRQGVQDAVLDLDASLTAAMAPDKFSKWRLDQTDKWAKHKADIERHTCQLVRDKVHQVFLYETHVTTYKQLLHQSILDRFNAAKASEAAFDLTDDDFDNMFDELLGQVHQEHPPFAQQVPDLIDDLFVRGNLFVPQQVDHGRTWYKPIQKIVKAMTSGLNTQSHMTRATMQQEVYEFVVADLASVPRYCEDKATDCILRTKQFIGNMRVSNKMFKIAVRTLRHAMIVCFVVIQRKWDEENSVAAKFATCRSSMKKFAQNLCSGYKAADLLIASMGDWIADNFAGAVAEQVISQVATALKNERWVSNASAMQARLDQSLVEELTAGQIYQVLACLEDPVGHSARVVERLIQAKVDDQVSSAVENVVDVIRECVAVAANAASSAEADRSTVFVEQLRLQVEERLRRGGMSVLVQNLPNVSDDLMNCDHQGPTIFSSNKDLNVRDSTLAKLEAHKAQLDPATFQTKQITASILAMIRDEAYGASSGVIPRCGKPCPRCKCPCTKALGHTSSTDATEALHDTYHQPIGLVGGGWHNSNQLVAETCPLGVQNNLWMVFASGDRPFKDFDKVYPGWALPMFQQPLPLREYIFADYQSQLADKYKRLPCSSVPVEYRHDLHDIACKIRRLL